MSRFEAATLLGHGREVVTEFRRVLNCSDGAGERGAENSRTTRTQAVLAVLH
ncbi:MAG: hypothetical protein WDN69_02215 [Aliidongia sp.]